MGWKPNSGNLNVVAQHGVDDRTEESYDHLQGNGHLVD